MRIRSQTLVRRSRSTSRSPQPTQRTTSIAARDIRSDQRKDRCVAPNGSRERFCDVRRQHVVRACAQVHGGPAKAAHQRSRPSETTGGPAADAIEDPAPLKIEALKGSGRGGMVILTRIHLPDRKCSRQPSAGHWCIVGGFRGRTFERTEAHSINADH